MKTHYFNEEIYEHCWYYRTAFNITPKAFAQTACGRLLSMWTLRITNKKSKVTCKSCLKQIEQHQHDYKVSL